MRDNKEIEKDFRTARYVYICVYIVIIISLLYVFKDNLQNKNPFNKLNKKAWLFGDTKTDRKGRAIYFVGYSTETDAKGNLIELWEPEVKFLNRKLDQ